MPDLDFHIDGVEPLRTAIEPTIAFKLRISEAVPPGEPPTQVHASALRCQIRIEPSKRPYKAVEQARLVDLFGTPDRWRQTLRPLLWAQINVVGPPFGGECLMDLPLPCSSDFNLATTRYLSTIEEGDIPLSFAFSGTVFYEAEEIGLQTCQIPWNREAHFQLSANAWRGLMDRYYPEGSWIMLRRDLYDRLAEYRSRNGLSSWDQALERLLATEEEPATP
jgi:hypothetical protein